jgi:ketosteroid isomerase-like protein
MDAYERAWRAAGTASLGELFAPDATYVNAPFREPVRGLEAIAEMWERERDGPDEAFEMEAELIAVEGDTGVARVEVRYGEPKPQLYRDLWVIRLDGEGRCVAFEEWPFWPPGSGGGYAGMTSRESG